MAGPDVFAHEGRPRGKVAALEAVSLVAVDVTCNWTDRNVHRRQPGAHESMVKGWEEREFFIDNPLFRVLHIDQVSWSAGLAPWGF